MPFLTELRRALRALRRVPGFVAITIVTLVLGIGVTAALFSIAESVLWRPLPFPDSERLALLSEHHAKIRPEGSPVSAANFLDWRNRARSFERMGAMPYGFENHTLTGAGERVRSAAVSAGFFETLGVQPSAGRVFQPTEETADAHVAILTDDFWRGQFGSTSEILNRTISLDRQTFTIIGVLPADFHLDSVMDMPDPQLFIPLDFTHAQSKSADRDLAVIARTKPGVSLAAASAEMNSLARRLGAEYPNEDAGWDLRAENLRQSFTHYNSTALYLFLGFAMFVLLIACANVAGLQLVRAVSRRHEFALRIALGAHRSAILRQALAETFWITVPSAVLATLMAGWGIAGVRAVMPPDSLARSAHLSLDLNSLAFVLVVALSTTLLVALTPVWLTRKLDLETALREGSKGVTASPRTQRKLNILVGAEMALSFVLLFGAGLFISSHAHLKQVPLGFDPHDVLTVRVTAGAAQQSSPEARRAFYGEMCGARRMLAA